MQVSHSHCFFSSFRLCHQPACVYLSYFFLVVYAAILSSLSECSDFPVVNAFSSCSCENISKGFKLAAVFRDCLLYKGEYSVFVSKIAAAVDFCCLHFLQHFTIISEDFKSSIIFYSLLAISPFLFRANLIPRDVCLQCPLPNACQHPCRVPGRPHHKEFRAGGLPENIKS